MKYTAQVIPCSVFYTGKLTTLLTLNYLPLIGQVLVSPSNTWS